MVFPYEAVVRGGYEGDDGRWHDGFGATASGELDPNSTLARLAYALYLADKKREDHGGHGFVPFWWEPIQNHKEHGYGFGVDLTQWHWCVWAQMARRAEAMSHDEKLFEQMDSELVAHPEIPTERADARAAILAKRAGK